ncbi:MAG: hypothetical protein IT221_10255 [Fluviicola sp.]|nr:hypothetical protein [Fluviicola sp.]
MLKRIVPLVILLVAISSCGSDTCEDCQVDPTIKKDTVVVDEMTEAIKKDTVIAPTKEIKENHAKIVKKYGEQWDFCTCIVANDSITDAFEKKLTPAQEQKLMDRWDYVDRKCKELTTFDNTTPEERAKHEKRVKKCLKENGLKM